MWEKLGFKLWTWFAWFITFNFVNIAWVFFRAKEWEDAVKVLSGMVGLSGIKVHSVLYSKLSFLENYGVEFGAYQAIRLPALEILWFILGFILVFLFKNSIQIIKGFKTSYKNLLIFIVTLFILATHLIYRLGESSEFLYFNF